MVYSPPLVPVQELEAVEQQMSELDAGNEQVLKQEGKGKFGVGDSERGYIAYSPDRYAEVVGVPSGKAGK
jgi:hypothetical protein